MRARLPVSLTFLALAAAVVPEVGRAQVVPQDEALDDAFPAPTTIDRRTAFLDPSQLEHARSLAGSGVEVERSVITYYVGTPADGAASVAYFDAHRVRTLPEVLMIVVDSSGAVASVRVLKFTEPPEYRAPDGWLRRFAGLRLDDELRLKRGVDGITGATLTSEAVTDAARRILALHAVIKPLGPTP